jgi:hypothetical protein
MKTRRNNMFAEKLQVLKNLYDTDSFKDLADSEDIVSEDALPSPYIAVGEVLEKAHFQSIYAVYKSVDDNSLYLTEESYQKWIRLGVLQEVK